MAIDRDNRNLDYFLSLDYTTQLTQRGAASYVYAPDLNLVAEGADPSEAYEEFLKQKQSHFKRVIEMGQAASIPLPRSLDERESLRRSLTPFLIKAAVIALIGVMLIIAANVSLTYTITESPKHMAQVAGRYMVRKFATEFARLAPENLSPERERKIREAVRAAVPTLKSLSGALSPLWDCPQENSLSQPLKRPPEQRSGQ